MGSDSCRIVSEGSGKIAVNEDGDFEENNTRTSNCSFCTGVLPYSVLVEICVAKARWDSALDD